MGPHKTTFNLITSHNIDCNIKIWGWVGCGWVDSHPPPDPNFVVVFIYQLDRQRSRCSSKLSHIVQDSFCEICMHFHSLSDICIINGKYSSEEIHDI